MPTFDDSFPAIEAALTRRYGLRDAGATLPEDPFAACIAVLLGRSIDAKKAAKAVDGLSEAGLLDAQALSESDPAEIIDAFKSGGASVPARVAGGLKRLAKWVVDRHHGSADWLRDGSVSTTELREELSSLNGIGPATADAILLLALQRASYPVDRATYRILVRHGWLEPSNDYEEARSVMERLRPDDPETLMNLSGWFEQVGREFCKPTTARCERCPLNPFLPEGGPLEPDAT